MRAWLIDDDHVTNMLNRYYLEEHFPHVAIELFCKATKALDELINIGKETDFIFLDLNMPEMNGWEFLDALVEASPLPNHFPKIYILSSSLDPADRLRAENHALVAGFISKPLESVELEFLIQEAVEIKK
jgi:CheY-like chemotaxis protein